ncbi:MAG: hypothetical protein IAI50_02445 [Candidatus Eremiobacteraeota bacterium]|nr:hypothetical protein [Candidatus Eremiobacteraeota bacterium]
MTNVQQVQSTMKDAGDTIWRNRIVVLVVFAILLGCSSVFVHNLQRQYVAGANVLVVNGNTRDDPTLSSPDLPSIATSTVVLDRMAKNLDLDIPLLTIKKHLTVKPPAFKSSIIRIEYTDSYSERAANGANGVADELTRYYGQISTSRYDADLGALNAELTRQTDRIKAITAQMQARGGSAVTAVDEKGNDPTAGRLTNLETDRELAKAALQGDIANTRSLGTDAGLRAKIVRRDVLESDQRYRQLLGAASSSALAVANAKAVYTGKYPALPALVTKSKSLDSAVDGEARRALSAPDAYSPSIVAAEAEQRKAAALTVADRAKVDALTSLIASERQRLNAQTPLEVLRLQKDAAQADYMAISSRRATALANRADALSLGSVVVVDRAIASEVQTGLGRNALAVVLTLLILGLSLGSAFVAELFNPRLRRAAQIENLYGRPVIATIGKM